MEVVASINTLFLEKEILAHLEACRAAIKEMPTLFSQPSGDSSYTGKEYLHRLYENYSNTVDNINFYSSSLKDLNTKFEIANNERISLEKNEKNLSKLEHDLACVKLIEKRKKIYV